MYHEPTPEVVAGAVPEVEAEAGVVAEVVTGVTVRVFLKVALGVDNQGSPSGSQSRRKVTFWEPEVELDPKEKKRIPAGAFHFGC